MDILARSKWPSHQLYLSLLCVLPLIHCSHIKDKPDDLRKEELKLRLGRNSETDFLIQDLCKNIRHHSKEVTLVKALN